MKEVEAKRSAPAGKRKKDRSRRAEKRVSRRTSELSRAAERIAESERLFRLSIENMLDGFAILSPVRGRGGEIEDFRFLHMNEAGCRITDFTSEEHLGSTLLSLYPEAGRGGLLDAFVRVAGTGESLSLDSWPYNGIFGGREVTRFFDIRAFRSGGNVAVVFRDITARKEAEETLSRLASFPEVNPNPVVEVDTGGAVHFLNAAARALFPDLEEAGPTHPWLVSVMPALDRIRRGVEGHTATLGVSAGDRHYQQSIHYLEGQERFRIYSIDITDRKRAEEELSETKMLMETLLRQAPVGFAYLDRDLRFLMINDHLAEINGLPAAAHIGRTVGEIVPTLLPMVQGVVDRILATGKPVIGHEYSGETPLQPGVMRQWVESWYPVCDPAGRINGFGAVSEEITGRKQTEAGIEASRQMLQTVVNHLPASVALIRGSDLRLLLVNPAYQAIGPGKEMMGRTLDELWPEAGQDFSAICRRVLETGEPHQVVDELNRISSWPGGPLESRYFSWSLHRVHLPGEEGWGLLNCAWETTERKRTEAELRESEARLKRSQEVGEIGWWKLDTRQNVLMWSEENHRIFGVSEGTPLTYETFLGIVHPDDRAYVDTRWQAALRGESYDIEHRLLVNGQVKWVREKAYLEFEDGGLLGGFGITQDVTARKYAEEALKTSLSEKEILLKELAHRTKNNMQVIVGLLDLQSAASKDEKTREALSDIQDRIRTMALVHENLYKTGNFSALSMRTYLQDLLDSHLRAYRKTGRSVTTCLDLEEVSVTINTALPCGLIVTELVSNSLKHAFAKGESGTIFLSLRKIGKNTEMRYRDDGPGIPPDLNLSLLNSLGLKLIRNLAVRQLRGTMDIRQGPGTEFVFGFRELDPGKRR